MKYVKQILLLIIFFFVVSLNPLSVLLAAVPTCSSWTDVFINSCNSSAKYSTSDPSCLTNVATVTIHVGGVNGPTEMKFFKPSTYATYCSSLNGSETGWTLPEPYQVQKTTFPLQGTFGEKKVCVMLKNNEGWGTACGAGIRYQAPSGAAPTSPPFGAPTAGVTDWVGLNQIKPPSGGGGNDYITGLTSFVNAALQLVFLGFGLYALFTFILAAYYFLSSQGKQENIDKAKKMFTYGAIGLVILASSFIGGAVIGKVFFNDWYFILDPSTTISCTIAEQQNNRLAACGGGPLQTTQIQTARSSGDAKACKTIYEQLRTISCPAP